MLEADTPATMEEIYGSAITSSNLRMEAREDAPNGAAAVLIAAGWSPSTLGAELMRMHSAFDGKSIPPGKPSPTDLRLFQMRLRELPVVHAKLTSQAVIWGIEDAGKVALAAIAHWLEVKHQPRGGKVSPPTPKAVKYGESGKRMVGYIEDCVSRAQQDIKKRLRGR